MKKAYLKPEIMFESFVSSTNIAGNCDKIVDSPVKGSCAYTISGVNGTWNVFTGSVSACTTNEGNVADMDAMSQLIYNSVCYHVPDGGAALFNS